VQLKDKGDSGSGKGQRKLEQRWELQLKGAGKTPYRYKGRRGVMCVGEEGEGSRGVRSRRGLKEA
jgi:hypothetical protein